MCRSCELHKAVRRLSECEEYNTFLEADAESGVFTRENV